MSRSGWPYFSYMLLNRWASVVLTQSIFSAIFAILIFWLRCLKYWQRNLQRATAISCTCSPLWDSRPPKLNWRSTWNCHQLKYSNHLQELQQAQHLGNSNKYLQVILPATQKENYRSEPANCTSTKRFWWNCSLRGHVLALWIFWLIIRFCSQNRKQHCRNFAINPVEPSTKAAIYFCR